ncbi:MAG: right-handed parallel beta-helix repeat-containing protein [Proteobacteria bacterium]|nr:right-handed parallel beta-helix repeat-containing protein [Pseudomonadota bacterium]MCP4919001.1 right-handed parallel beta-helix repeat-containing protein [Pseudomonadota bacterium]
MHMAMPALLLAVGCTEAQRVPPTEDALDSAEPCDGLDERVLASTIADHGDPAEEGSTAALLADLPTDCAIALVLDQPVAYSLGQDLELPPRSTLSFMNGAWLQLAEGRTLTIDGALEAGAHRIFDGGTVAGTPTIDFALPEWFGAVVDDDTSDHAALQDTFQLHRAVTLQAGVYDLDGTVVLPSSAVLAGPDADTPVAVLRSTLVYPETEGFHPTRLLEATGAADVTVRDLVLDGNRHDHQVEPWHYPETDNLARFEGVHGLSFERVHITGWEANWGIEDQSFAHATAVLDSRAVSFTDVSFTDSRTEGLLFQDSQDVVIRRLSTHNVDVWSPLNVFYVDGFELTDSTIVEDDGIEWSGSTVNLTVKNAVVSGNAFTGGWGVDFGDEGGTTPWGPTNILFEDNTVETIGAGIYFTPYADGDEVTNVQLLGNTLTLHRTDSVDDYGQMIRIDAAADVVIEDNILISPPGGDSFSQGISFQATTSNVLVRDNIFSGVDAGISHSGDTPYGGDLTITGNAILCSSTVRRDSWQGGSTGVWIFRYQSGLFDSVTVTDNQIEAVGGWVSLHDYATLSGAEQPPFVDQLIVTGNAFLPETGSERDISAVAADDATIEDNTPEWVNP